MGPMTRNLPSYIETPLSPGVLLPSILVLFEPANSNVLYFLFGSIVSKTRSQQSQGKTSPQNRKSGRKESIPLRRPDVFNRPGGPTLPSGRQRCEKMVDGL